MDQDTFAKADDGIDQLAEVVDNLLQSTHAEDMRRALISIARSLGDRYSVGLDMVLHIFDREAERSMPLLTTGLAVSDEEETYRTWGDSTPQRYVAEGEIKVVPHDRCPCCWGEWDFKFESQECPSCGALLGDDVKVLLDSDVCPQCEDGSISASSPECEKCGFQVNPYFVTWG